VLHDIGKLAVPEYIISKPGKLTPDEFEKMKVHPVVGAEILEYVQFPYAVAPIVRSHHEKWDGSGYPDGLSGEQIPIGARILSAVDCLDALASDRQYRRALPLEEAIGVVRAEAGHSFDPRVVDVLERRYVELEKMAKAGIAKRKGVEIPRLSTDLKIERGSAPAAGFAAGDTTRPAPGGYLSNLNRALATVTAGMANGAASGDAMALLAMQMYELIPYDAIVLYDIRTDTLVPVWQSGEQARLFASFEIPMGSGLSGWFAENGRAIVNGNPSVEPGFLNDPARFGSLRSALAVPISGTPGGVPTTTGVLAMYHHDRDAFNAQHLEVLSRIEPLLSRQLSEGRWEPAVA